MLAYDTGAERHGGQSWIFGDHEISLWSFSYADEQGHRIAAARGWHGPAG